MFVDTAYAEQTTSIFWNAMDLGEFLLLAVSILVLFASIATVIFILRWWVLVILSWWKDEKIKPAINTIRYAFFWLIIIVATIFISPIVGRILGLDVEKYLEPKAIFSKIEDLWSRIFWWWSSSSIDNTDIFKEDDFINNL